MVQSFSITQTPVNLRIDNLLYTPVRSTRLNEGAIIALKQIIFNFQIFLKRYIIIILLC